MNRNQHKSANLSQAKFFYTSECCGAATKKDPCERSKSDLKEGKFSEASLGKWYCVKCHSKCKVTRSKNG